MVEIYTGNQTTPKKKPLVNWGFTTREDGPITKFRFPESESAFKRMERELENINKWGKYPGPHPENMGGSRAYTIVTIIPDYDIIKIHCLYFPDGKVWDSSLRDYRPIRDYERKKNR